LRVSSVDSTVEALFYVHVGTARDRVKSRKGKLWTVKKFVCCVTKVWQAIVNIDW